MRKSHYLVFSIAVLATLATAAAAGIGPSYGLPNVNFSVTTVRGTSATSAPAGTADNNYYQVTVAIPGVRGSATCVACHTRNPSPYTYYARQGATRPTGSNVGALYGSHWVTSTFDGTNEGGGYGEGKSGLRAASPIYMAVATNVAGNGYTYNTYPQWPAAPKYGDGSSSAVNVNDNNPNNVAAEMICDSCHNIVVNGGNPYKLLAQGIADRNDHPGTADYTTTDALCRGCHGDMESGLNNEWQYFPLTSGTWSATQHHRNGPVSGIRVGKAAGTGYFGTGTSAAGHNMSLINAAYYTQTVQMWAAGIGSRADGALVWGGTRVCAGDVGAQSQIASGRTGGVLNCTSCHRAHNADSSAGATILMRSNVNCAPGGGAGATDLSATPIGASAAGAIQVSLELGTDNAWRGVTRMQDRGGRTSAFSNTNPNCLSCHM